MADPVRILDTRDPVNVGLGGPFVSPIAQKLQVTGSIPTSAGAQTVVPAGSTGVLLNVTAVGATADGFISIRPGDATGPPATSSLNVTAGVTVPNAVQVALPVAGANAGKIDITWDALGVAGPTTDILIDVVGYTTDAKLTALQAEVDALEVAKADKTDVYTKTEIDTSSGNSLQRAGQVSADGVVDPFYAKIGDFSATRTSEGRYTVTVPAYTAECNFPLIRLIPLQVGFSVVISSGDHDCVADQLTFAVSTYDMLPDVHDNTPDLVDGAFGFAVLAGPRRLSIRAS